MKHILYVFCALVLLHCSNPEQAKRLESTQNELQAMKDAMANQGTAGFIHTVFFWLKPGISEADRTAFLEGVSSLREVQTIKAYHVGVPAKTPRDVVDNSYDYALILHFADAAGQDAYQIDPIHERFVEAHKDKWVRVQVYDTVVE